MGSVNKFIISKFGQYLNIILEKFGYRLRKLDSYSSPSSDIILKSLFRRGEKIIIFDIGAHRGESAKKYREMFDEAQIYSFEPFPDSFEYIRKLSMKNFKPFNFGFSDKTSIEKFYINDGSATNSLLELAESAYEVWDGNDGLKKARVIDCEFKTIDEFCDQNSICNIDFMKIDVQGGEYKVLTGANISLLNKKISVIQIEVIIGKTYNDQKSMAYYIEFLESYGYRLKNISDFSIINGNLVQADLFFTAF